MQLRGRNLAGDLREVVIKPNVNRVTRELIHIPFLTNFPPKNPKI